MSEKVPEISESEFNSFIEKEVVLIDFFAEWCMPCLMMSPILDELSEKLKGRVKIGKVNVGENPNIAKKFNVASIPNMTLFRDGKVVEQIIGAIPEEEIEKIIKNYI